MADSSTIGLSGPVIEQLAKLKSYANMVLVEEMMLSETEQEDKESRLLALRELGAAHGLSQKDIVKLVFGKMLRQTKRCGCPPCRARRQMWDKKAGRGVHDGPPSQEQGDSAA